MLCWKIDVEDQRRNSMMSGYEWYVHKLVHRALKMRLEASCSRAAVGLPCVA